MTQDVAAARADLERLAKLADEATPGPWMPTVGHPSGRFYGVHTADGPIVRFNGIAKGSTVGHANAAFIAAANPVTIKALLARVAALEEVETAARAYFMGWVQDEAADDGPEFTGCSDEQHRAAIALKDALNDSQKGGGGVMD